MRTGRLSSAVVPVLVFGVLVALRGHGDAGTPYERKTIVPISIRAGGASKGADGAVLRLLPGELPEGRRIEIEENGQRKAIEPEVLSRHVDGSARAVRIPLPAAPPIRPSAGKPSLRILLCVLPRAVDPASLVDSIIGSPGTSAQAPDLAAASVAVGNVADLLAGGAVAADTSFPAWWGTVEASISPEIKPGDYKAQLENVRASYADKGRAREAIRLNAAIATAAARKDSTSALRASYEVAQLYEVFERDFGRALAWYQRCQDITLEKPTDNRQNAIASNFGCLRSIAGLGESQRAEDLYRVFMRDLLLVPDPYGNVVLPEVLYDLAQIRRKLGDADGATVAYTACLAATQGLPPDCPTVFRAPSSSATTALSEVRAQVADFRKVPDGSYQGQAYGFNAAVKVQLTFRGGRCTGFHILGLGDKRPFDAYDVIPSRVLEAQRLHVDAVTGATITSRAIENAAAAALPLNTPAGHGPS